MRGGMGGRYVRSVLYKSAQLKEAEQADEDKPACQELKQYLTCL